MLWGAALWNNPLQFVAKSCVTLPWHNSANKAFKRDSQRLAILV